MFIALERLIHHVKDRLDTGEQSAGPLAIFTGVSLDLFSDGVMIGRRTRLLMAASFALPVLIGAALGYLALRQAPEIVTLSVLAATGGVLTCVVLEEMVTQAHEGPTSSYGPLLLTAGFGLFALISVYVTI